MNEKEILEIMNNSFKKANIDLAVQKGMSLPEASKYIEEMSDIINKCMSLVLEDLLNAFPNLKEV